MVLVHLTASTFFGGPERQMLGLAQSLPAGYRTVFLSFAERGRCRAFVDAMRGHGFEADALAQDTPCFRRAVRELAGRLREHEASVLFCHGYKADLRAGPGNGLRRDSACRRFSRGRRPRRHGPSRTSASSTP